MNTALTVMLAMSCFGLDEPKTGALLQALPPDGAWVTFQVVATGEGKNVPLTWTFRSVGTSFHEGDVCRNLELEQACDNGVQQIFGYALEPKIWRIIVPESAFGEGKDPFAKVVKIWVQQAGNSPKSITSLEVQDPILAAIVYGPSAKLKAETQSEKIEWQRGELSCQVTSGTREIDFLGAKVEMNSRVLRHPDVPFSIVGLRQEIKATFETLEYKASVKATLRDYGTDAKPKLPQLTP